MASVTLIGDDELLAGLLKEARFEKKKAAVKKLIITNQSGGR